MSGPLVQLRDNIAVVGWSCRLPGANSVAAFWSLLLEGRCAVSKVPADRFSLEKYYHPRRQEPGKSYTWAAGILDDVWGFDPSVFGISPREAVQIDPQQRILLQLTWEALEDAGILPSKIANTEVGVFVGASQTDYGHAFFGDTAIADAHFAPGTAVAILANRISYVYSLHGPSITVDTACSSSLVALHQAVEALKSGRIDTAIVAGTNLIASPASFIAFSQANMLSPHGLCQAFSSKADGFVRAEGAVVFVLRKTAHALASENPIRGIILGSDVNSDGRTNGISLPSIDAQEALLDRVYSRNGIDRNRLAFIEAHGTGTPVGDPIEAAAIGRSIGRNRTDVLSIGSVKTNIGHLEPASGLAGVLKALLALNHGVLPPSLHFTEPSPHIPFDELNLKVCTQPMLLPNAADQYAGINSFGFGGTNSHAIVAAGRKQSIIRPPKHQSATNFVFSAESVGALKELARQYADRVCQLSDGETAELASAVAYRRERQAQRIAIASTKTSDVVQALDAFSSDQASPFLTSGSAVGEDSPIAFVYAGNGSQWAGMGQTAYRQCAAFRSRFDQIDGYFQELGGWSLKEALFRGSLEEDLALTSIAQPLIFAIQCSSTAALRDKGIHPAAVLGHSVGEVAAAEAAGALDLRTAVKVIHFRSTHQELVKGAGRMAAVLAAAEDVQLIVDEFPGLEIAAINSPKAVTIAGSAECLAGFKKRASDDRIALVDLDLDYPFHTSLMDAVERPLRRDLADIIASDTEVAFVSTVTGKCVSGSGLGASYWWRNVREPVQFAEGIRAAAELGARYFVEISPRPILAKHISDCLQGDFTGYTVQSVLDRNNEEIDPFQSALGKAIVSGAGVDRERIFGSDPGPGIALPFYPWQQKHYRFKATVEAIGDDAERHILAGSRISADELTWRAHIDTSLCPWLSDHKLGERTIFPGAGFLEVALWVAKQWLKVEAVILTDFEITNPLDLTNGESRELMTRVSPDSNTLEILSRPRLSSVGWISHCRCKAQSGAPSASWGRPKRIDSGEILSAERLYEIAEASGLNYGDAFKLVCEVAPQGDGKIVVELNPDHDDQAKFVLDPMRLDCSAHGFFAVFPELRANEREVAYIPVRIDELNLHKSYGVPSRAIIEITNKSERSIVGNCTIYDRKNEVVATLRGVRSQAVSLNRKITLNSSAFVEIPRSIDGAIAAEIGVRWRIADVVQSLRTRPEVRVSDPSPSDAVVLLEGWATAVGYEVVSALSNEKGFLNVEMAIANGRIPESLRGWINRILTSLDAAGLVEKQLHDWKLLEDPSMPPSGSLVKALVSEQPSRASEALLASAVSGLSHDLIVGKQAVDVDAIISKQSANFYHATSATLRHQTRALLDLLKQQNIIDHDRRKLRVLQIGYADIVHSLLSEDNVQLTILEPDQRRCERAEAALNRSGVKLVTDCDTTLGEFDLILGVSGLHRLPDDFVAAHLKKLMAPGGLVLALEPQPSLFRDIIFGIDPKWFGKSASGEERSPLRNEKVWAAIFKRVGLHCETVKVQFESEPETLIIAKNPDSLRSELVGTQTESSVSGAGLIFAPTIGSDILTALRDQILEYGLAVQVEPGPNPEELYSFSDRTTEGLLFPDHQLTHRCLRIKECAERFGQSSGTLWILFSGALSSSAPVDPIETGAWAFCRTLANEFPKLDLRRIDLDQSSSSPELVARRIRQIVSSGSDETELQITNDAVRAVRVETLGRSLRTKGDNDAQIAWKLERRVESGERLVWRPTDRRTPAADEVEIEVVATGLNFRDLMWSMSLLPDDMLEDGFSGPSLGLECAGRVTQVGRSVKSLNVGDRVMAFAASSFASYLTLNSTQAVKIPGSMTCEAAATIPVAFFTAYYSLITQAKLSRKEWVLIHGGAGAVGMAAIQIAQVKGARVIATAGSTAKRNLLRSLGVEHVFDSRSTTFVDDVRRVVGQGVDIVLNSLAGEAMERSIATLRPFGRFVELGKRDYVTNTHIGLRPFRKNLSYFGVDVDQVIGARRKEADKIFRTIVQRFESGIYVPLPYSVFEGESVAEAFQLMQQSSHIGKIVVRPSRGGNHLQRRSRFSFDKDRTHVVTGAFGGFGGQTARWLIEHGARHLVLIGRQGAVTSEAHALVNELTAMGANVMTASCDVADLPAVESLFSKIRSDMPPIAGVMHEAMVLDDGAIMNLNDERFLRVLRPKVLGAQNLDHALQQEKLDYFVLFSSVTTLIGNPGQGNYVAANAYMEGFARRRRQRGLPALAVGWGPIIDVGVVAGNKKLQAGLEKLTGLTGMRSREALDLLAEALELSKDVEEAAVITLSHAEGSFSSDRLAVLRSPTYAAYLGAGRGSNERSGETVDLHSIAAAEGAEAAERKVLQVITVELARVLHMSEEDINSTRPLGEIGLDSLMALELVLNLENAFGIKIPLSGSSGGMTISDIAREIMAHVGVATNEGDALVATLAEQHHGAIDIHQLDAVKEVMADSDRLTKRLLQ